MRPTRCRMALLLSVLLGAAALADEPTQPEAGDAAFREAMVREAQLPPVEIHAPGDAWTATLPARLVGEVEPRDDAFELRLDVGADAPAHCFVYALEIEPATTLLRATGQPLSKDIVVGHRLAAIDASADGAAAHLFLAWQFEARTDESEKPVIGLLQAAAGFHDGRSAVCVLEGIGFRATFRHAFASLLSTLHFREPDPNPPRAREIALMRYQGLAIGLRVTDLRGGGPTRDQLVTRHASLSPVGESIVATDTSEVQTSDASGALHSGALVQTRNGRVFSKLRLEPLPEGGFQVNGLYQQREIDQKIDSDAAPGSALGRRRMLAEMATALASKAPIERQQVEWVPTTDALRFVPVDLVLERATEDGNFEGTVRFGPMDKAEAPPHALTIDANGSPLVTRSPVGPNELVIERVHSSGPLR